MLSRGTESFRNTVFLLILWKLGKILSYLNTITSYLGPITSYFGTMMIVFWIYSDIIWMFSDVKIYDYDRKIYNYDVIFINYGIILFWSILSESYWILTEFVLQLSITTKFNFDSFCRNRSQFWQNLCELNLYLLNIKTM